MSLTLDQGMASLLEAKTFRLATIWQLNRRDGVILRFTDHDCDLVYGIDTYKTAGAFDVSAESKQDALRPERREIHGVLTSGAITTEDLLAGRYRGCKITERIIDWRFPWVGAFRTTFFWITNTRFNGVDWDAEIAGIGHFLSQAVGQAYTRDCRYDLYAPRCTVLATSFDVLNAQVNVVTDRRNFTVVTASLPSTSDGYYDFGKLVWKTGDNAGIVSEVKKFINSPRTIELQLSTPFDIDFNDTFDLFAGCDKKMATCNTKFANRINFGGFPYIPGNDKLLQTPNKR